ncbi:MULTISPECIES: PH domain-containing protein [Nocardiopsis]|uniref:PH domain-containing protein n=1 Tax=Nocardiopsis TaxID=2013 RepID=UPI000345BD74|nr:MULTISPECIES: PH domain-containing protein [Nocardiopsis]
MGDDGKPLTATLPRVLSWIWVGVAALLLLDLALNGSDTASLVAAGVLLLTVGGVYVLWLRPRVVPGQDGVRVVNPLRETFVPWSEFTWADVTDVLRVHAGGTVVRSWALRETKRAKVRENLRRAGGYSDTDPVAESDPRELRPVELHAKRLREIAERRKARPSGGTERAEGVVTAVSPDAVAALALPVALLAAVALLF